MRTLSALLLLTLMPASTMAREVLVSSVAWLASEPPLICELSSGPESVMEGQLRCFIDLSDTGERQKGKEVFTYRDPDRGPISVAPALGPAGDVLITMWESGAYACYTGFGYHEEGTEGTLVVS